ncbi:MAG TPA: universal stress protein [Ferruginibacter sp.]|nr:universal stress protein [Ferruginibacter sp.]
MIKIVAVFDGLKFSAATLDYAIHLCNKQSTHLVAVFLDDFTYHSYRVYPDLMKDPQPAEKQAELEKKDSDTRKASRERFEKACHEHGISYTIHIDKSIAYQELIHETIYADLVIICFQETFTRYDPGSHPSAFIRDLMVHTQCPLLLVPPVFHPVDRTCFLFNGQPSSVYALKQYNYLLGAVHALPVEVITVKDDDASNHLPDNHLLRELLKRHYKQVDYTMLKGMIAEVEIVDHLRSRTDHPLIVLGAYQRGMVSRWFRPSMADELIKELSIPIFVAHT